MTSQEQAAKPLIQITRRGIEVNSVDVELAELRGKFEAQRWLLLPNFFDHSLLDLISQHLVKTEFRIVDRETGTELRPIDCTPYLAAELLLNDPKVLRMIERITGCARLACFSGRIYRRVPGSDHFNRWHSDVTEGRAIALSVNLSEKLYEGGELQIRSADSHQVLCTVENPQSGDAIIFPVDEKFQHRISDVTGGAPKTALAGWFRSRFDANSLFGRDRKAGE